MVGKSVQSRADASNVRCPRGLKLVIWIIARDDLQSLLLGGRDVEVYQKTGKRLQRSID